MLPPLLLLSLLALFGIPSIANTSGCVDSFVCKRVACLDALRKEGSLSGEMIAFFKENLLWVVDSNSDSIWAFGVNGEEWLLPSDLGPLGQELRAYEIPKPVGSLSEAKPLYWYVALSKSTTEPFRLFTEEEVTRPPTPDSPKKTDFKRGFAARRTSSATSKGVLRRFFSSALREFPESRVDSKVKTLCYESIFGFKETPSIEDLTTKKFIENTWMKKREASQ